MAINEKMKFYCDDCGDEVVVEKYLFWNNDESLLLCWRCKVRDLNVDGELVK